MKAVELFCCSGGFSLGAHAAGFEVACAYDIDPILTSSWVDNFPTVELKHSDISGLTGAQLEADAGDGKIDLLFGGPPCQGFSSIGRRDKNDERRRLPERAAFGFTAPAKKGPPMSKITYKRPKAEADRLKETMSATTLPHLGELTFEYAYDNLVEED